MLWKALISTFGSVAGVPESNLDLKDGVNNLIQCSALSLFYEHIIPELNDIALVSFSLPTFVWFYIQAQCYNFFRLALCR